MGGPAYYWNPRISKPDSRFIGLYPRIEFQIDPQKGAKTYPLLVDKGRTDVGLPSVWSPAHLRRKAGWWKIRIKLVVSNSTSWPDAPGQIPSSCAMKVSSWAGEVVGNIC